MAAANTSLIQRCAFVIFALAVALLPIGLGGNRMVPFALFQGALAVSLALILIAPPVVVWTRPVQVIGVLMILPVLWAAAQILPIWPNDLVHYLWPAASAALRQPLSATLTIDPDHSWHSLARLLTYSITGLTAFILLQDLARMRQLLACVFGVAVVVACYGLLNMGNSTILSVATAAYPNDVTGTFINRNHFALYAGLAVIMGAGLLWRALRQQKARTAILYGLGLLPLLIALGLSHSRAGLIASALGALVFLAAMLVYVGKPRVALIAPVLLGCFLAASLLLVDGGRWQTLFADYSSRDRGIVYEKTITLISQRPLTGYGLGSFEDTMPAPHNRAHSDWLESMHDLGIPAALLLWAAVACAYVVLSRGLMRLSHHGTVVAIALGGAAAVLAHSLVDFSLQIPAISVLFACLLGGGMAAVRQR